MINKRVLISSIALFGTTMLIFFIVQLFLRTQAYFSFSEYQYLLSTAICNAFILTTLYAIVGAYNMVSQIHNKEIRMGTIFKLTFSPGIIAGLISVIAIFGYFWYFSPEGIEQLKTEYLDYSLLAAKGTETYEGVAEIVNSSQARNANILNIKTFSLMSLVVIFFNLSLAIMLSLLWKIKQTPITSK